MDINAIPIHDDFDPMCLNGPWSNDACMGYLILAMENAGFSMDDINKTLNYIWRCFDDTSVEGAAGYYSKW